MNGLEFIGIVARDRPHIQAVLITATSRERLDSYIRTHPVRYIRKPIDLNVLLTMLGSSATAN